MEERFLLARLQHKDEKALAQLIDQYAGYVLATVRAAGAGVLAEADLEEAAADTFVKLWGAAASVRPEKGGLKAYLGSIARKEARSRVRRARPVLPLEEDEARLVQQKLNLSDAETLQIIRNRRGEGLLCIGQNRFSVAFRPTKLEYELITTSRKDLERIAAQNRR